MKRINAYLLILLSTLALPAFSQSFNQIEKKTEAFIQQLVGKAVDQEKFLAQVRISTKKIQQRQIQAGTLVTKEKEKALPNLPGFNSIGPKPQSQKSEFSSWICKRTVSEISLPSNFCEL